MSVRWLNSKGISTVIRIVVKLVRKSPGNVVKLTTNKINNNLGEHFKIILSWYASQLKNQ